MSATEIGRRLSDAAHDFRRSHDRAAWSRLQSIAIDAVRHVDATGDGTVDHIVLSSVLSRIVKEVPALATNLEEAGWRWYR